MAEKKAEKKEEKKEEAKKGKAGGVIVIIVLLIIAGGFVFEEIKFNLLGTRDHFVLAVAQLDPAYRTYEEKYLALEARAGELDKRQSDMDTRETQLNSFQEELELREAEIVEREAGLTPIYLQPLSGKELEDMQSLSTTYSQMAPETAADILASLYNQQDIAAILYHMSERSAAAVLSAMDVDLAASLTEILLYK